MVEDKKKKRPAIVLFNGVGIPCGFVNAVRTEPNGQNFKQLNFKLDSKLRNATWTRTQMGWLLGNLEDSTGKYLDTEFSDAAIGAIFWQPE